MSHSFSKLRLFALSAVCWILPITLIAADEQQITLEQIKAKASQWRSAIFNLQVVFETRSLPQRNEPLIDWPPPSDAESAPRFSQIEWIWSEDGLDLYEHRNSNWRPGYDGRRDIEVINGPQQIAFRAEYRRSPDGIEELKRLYLKGAVGTKTLVISQKSLTIMEGLYWVYTAEWLPEILAKWEWTLEGIDPVFEHPCAKITAQHATVANQSDIEILWLDLKHDFLPRRYERLHNPGASISYDFVVDEFQRLDGGLWFPKLAREQLQSDPRENHLVVVTEAAINQSLDLSRFDPPMPEVGTRLTDTRTDKADSDGVGRKRKQKATNPTSATSNTAPVSASATTPWISLIFGSLALVAVGLWFRR